MRIKTVAFVMSLLLNIALFGAVLATIESLGGLRYLAFKVKTGDGSTGISAGRAEMFQSIDKGIHTADIVFLGDSITEMIEWADVFPGINAVNRGIGGDTTTLVLRRLDEVVETQPRKIFLMLGINDLLTSTPDQVFDRYRRIVNAIRTGSPKTVIYIESVLPVNNTVRETRRKNADVVALNAQLEALARTGDHLRWVNLYPVFVDKSGEMNANLTYDGLHPSGAGIATLTQTLAPLVKELR